MKKSDFVVTISTEMTAFVPIKYNLLLFLFLSCVFSLKAQDFGVKEATYPKVQRIAVRANGNDTFVLADSASLLVFAFLSPECPLCKNYSLVLNTLQKKFGSKVQFVGIVPGRTYTEEDVQQYVKDYKVQFPVYIDLQKELSNYVKATTTPEVVLLNKSGGLVYRGAIDDWVQALGQNKAKAKQRYLEDAISSYLQNKKVLVKQTPAIGCLINEF